MFIVIEYAALTHIEDVHQGRRSRAEFGFALHVATSLPDVKSEGMVFFLIYTFNISEKAMPRIIIDLAKWSPSS